MEASPMPQYLYHDDSNISCSPEMDLLAASSIGDIGIVHRLLQQGSNVDQRNESGWTSLMYAAHYGHYNVVKMLIDYGATVDIQEWIQGRSPLMLAASCGHTRCLEVLISLGSADTELTDYQGKNAAYYAIHSGHGRNKIIAKLLKIQPKSSRSASRQSSRPLTKTSQRTNEIVVSSTSSSPSRNPIHQHHHPEPSPSSSKQLTANNNPPDIIISKDEYGTTTGRGESPFNHGGGIYSPYMPLISQYSSPRGCSPGPYNTSSCAITPSNPNMVNSTSSFQSPNPDLTPHLTMEMNAHRLGKRRLPMYDRYHSNSSGSGPAACKSSRREVASNPSPFCISSNDGMSSKELTNIIDQVLKCPSNNQFNHHHSVSSTTGSKPGPLVNSGGGGCGIDPSGQSPSSNSSTDAPNDTGISVSTTAIDQLSNVTTTTSGSSPSIGSGDEQACSTTTIASQKKPSSEINRSKSPLPENLDCLLERIGLTQYGPLFAAHGIDLYCFLTLNESDLEEVGIHSLGHKRTLSLAQLRFRESVEILNTQERFFADWLLSERESLKKENHELKMKLKSIESLTGSSLSSTSS